MRNTKLVLLGIALLFPNVFGCSSANNSRTSTPTTTRQQPAEDIAGLAAVPRIIAAEADALVRQDRAVIIDVRTEAAYRSQHIKGAISIPEAQVAPRFSMLPRDKKIITYCT